MIVQRWLSVALLTMSQVSFFAFLYVFFSYHSSRPDHPDPPTGRVFGSSNHGSMAYLTAVEATGLALLLIMSMLGFILRGTVVSKEYRRHLPSSMSDYIAAIAVAAGYLLLTKFAGPTVAGFAVAHGIVINW